MILLVVRAAVPANHRARESLFYASLGHIDPRGGLDLSSPSVLIKVNCLVMRYLYFLNLRGELQEDSCYASRYLVPLSLVPIPFFSSTNTAFLCAFCLRNPRFRAFRAQNRVFCARVTWDVGLDVVIVGFGNVILNVGN